MLTRLLAAALWRRRGMVALAVVAIAIGGSIAAALLAVSADVGRKLTVELRALGPNLLVVPETGERSPAVAPTARPFAEELASHDAGPVGSGFLDEDLVRARLARAGVAGTPLLYAVGEIESRPVMLVGADLETARRLHPSWSVAGVPSGSIMGARLMRRLGVRPGAPLRVSVPGAGRSVTLAAGAPLEAGGADDECWWLPLRDVQELAGLPGRVSLAQARVDGGARAVEQAALAIERGGGLSARPLYALSATEGRLLDRTRRLMTLVTIAVLIGAGLCAFGTLTDLALERRREIALMKALGASAHDVVRQLTTESLVVGLAGGLLGWLLGLGMAQLIGREVFHSPVALRWDALLPVLGLSIAIAVLAGLGPIRLALAVDPAPVLKGE